MNKNMYQIKISLMSAKPPIWRRLLAHSSIRLDTLHNAIQYSMGWHDSHLHQFEIGGHIYGMKDDEFDDEFGFETNDERNYKLSDLLTREKNSMVYEYDFGDGWRHKITLEKIFPSDPSAELVKCIKGKRACPPEDCGGIWGYENLLEIINDPEHPEHEEMLEWVGEEFDPEYFSLDMVNTLLFRYVN